MYSVYILINKERQRTYTGSTSNLKSRVNDHNSGKVKPSKSYRPYDILHVEKFDTLIEARRKEKFFKSTAGRTEIKKILEEKSESPPPKL